MTQCLTIEMTLLNFSILVASMHVLMLDIILYVTTVFCLMTYTGTQCLLTGFAFDCDLCFTQKPANETYDCRE